MHSISAVALSDPKIWLPGKDEPTVRIDLLKGGQP